MRRACRFQGKGCKSELCRFLFSVQECWIFGFPCVYIGTNSILLDLKCNFLALRNYDQQCLLPISKGWREISRLHFGAAAGFVMPVTLLNLPPAFP